MKNGFDNDKYLKMQSEHIRERIAQFGNKLYLEFGGKLFDDYHASRVLPTSRSQKGYAQHQTSDAFAVKRAGRNCNCNQC